MTKVVHHQDSAESRSAKLTVLLRSIEDYVNEVVASNHGMQVGEMQKMINDNLQRSMKANADYHKKVVRDYEKANEIAKAHYHKQMAQIYSSFFK